MTENNEPDNRCINIDNGNYIERIERDYVQGNYYRVTFNFRRENKNYDRIRRELLKIITDRIEYFISSSLDNRVYVVLEMDRNPEQIESYLQGDVKVNFQRRTHLNNTEIFNVFTQSEVAGRLLILGHAGSGKTIMLYKLAEELVNRANDNFNHPIPVIFSLSSWNNDSQSIKDWLINELKDKYGLRKDIGKGLVDDQEIIPLLDGLDELAAERQENCVIKINEFLQPSNWTNPVVVCSRIQEYERYKALLQLNNSIELCPLSQKQVYQYLQNTDNSQLWDSISHDADLSQLAKTPLLLNIIVLSAQEISIQTWQQSKSSEERLSYLFDAYIRKMLKRSYKGKDKQPKQENTQRWLSWLAQRLIEESATEFLIEKMQPYWLKNQNKKLIYNLVIWQVMGGFTFGFSFSVVELMFSLKIEGKISVIIGLSSGLIIGLIGGLIVGLIKYKNETVKISKPSLEKSPDLLIIGLINGLIILEIFLGLGVGGLMLGLISENQIRQIYEVLRMVAWIPIAILQTLLGVMLMFVAPIMCFTYLISKLFPNLNLNLLKLVAPDARMEILRSSYEQAMKEVNSEVRGERIKTLVKVMKVTPDEHMKVLRLIDEQTKRVNSEVNGDKIKTVEQLKFSWKKFQSSFSRQTLFFSVIAPILLVTFFAFVLPIDWDFRLGMILSMMRTCASSLCGLVFFAVLYGISAVEIEKKDIPNQGIRTSVVNIVIFSIITAPLATIFLFLPFSNESFNKSLILGLLFGIFFGIVRSGTPAIKHFVLRVILWSNGYAPWNYAKFLDYCTNRLFLQRVGGGYRFMHDLLRQHFANSYGKKI